MMDHTYTSRIHGTSSMPAVTMARSCMAIDCEWSVLPDSGSDHLHILTKWPTNVDWKNLEKRRWNFK